MSKPLYRAIRAQQTDTTITVYQAYSPGIAEPAIKAGKFVSPFKRTRMTWIKPSFLWMAYRSGWASKPNQERVLAIEITRAGFEWALRNSCLSHFDPSVYKDKQALEARARSTCIRVQWDPERDFNFNPLPHRSIQIGLKDEAVDLYVDKWIVSIKDVTDLVCNISDLISLGRLDEARASLPKEMPYTIPDDIVSIIGSSIDPGGEPNIDDQESIKDFGA
ncbi:hypothetical protein FQN57_002778 [Myotisia sp. PD_48]|nr:hypothetical protein FQN57_002778 [Myotisia sp. PD_48]